MANRRFGNTLVAMPRVQQDFYTASFAVRPDYLIQWLAVMPNTAGALGRTTSIRDLSIKP